jgi:hypothetical protein
LQAAADISGMKTVTGIRRTPPLIRTVALAVTMLVLLAGTNGAARAGGDEGWWPEYDSSGFWWGLRSAAEFEGSLVVSGDFWTIDNKPTRWVVRWDGRQWQPMGTGLASGLDDLTVFRGNLIGLAGSRGYQTPASLRQWNGSSWVIVADQPASIRKLLVLDSERLIAITDSQLHLWNGEQWSTFGPSGTFREKAVAWSDGVAVAQPNGQVVVVHEAGITPLGTPNGGVTLLGVLGGVLVEGVGAGRLNERDVYLGQVRAWNGASWQPMGAALEGFPTHLIDGPAGPEVLWQDSDDSTVGRAVRRWDGDSWEHTGDWFDFHVSEWKLLGNGRVAVGDFWIANGLTSRGLAMDSGNGLEPVRGPDAPVGGADLPVRALFEYDGELVVGGSFISLGERANPFIAIGDGRTWRSLGDGLDGAVYAMCEFNGDLIVAGDFQTAGAESAPGVARWDGTRWHAMGSGLDGQVLCLASFGGKLFAGGRFRHSGTTPLERLAAWDGQTWSAAGRFDRPVHALAVYQGALFAGGEFRRVNDSPGNALARWDGTSWGVPFDVTGSVLALTPHDGRLAVGGMIRRLAGVPCPPLLLVDGQTIQSMPARLPRKGEDASIWAMQSTPRGLVIGGSFDDWPTSGIRGGLARWDGTTWNSFGSGVSQTAMAIANLQGRLFVGGDFESAGGRPSERLARWSDGVVPANIGALTIERDHAEVRLAWNTAGLTNLSGIEVWVGGEAAGVESVPGDGQAEKLGTGVRRSGGAFEFVDASARPDGARYWLRQVGPFGSDSWSGPYALAPLPPGARIQSIGPNPFFSATQVHYTLDRAGAVAIEVFDAQGRRIRVLQRGEQPAGVFEAEWDGRNDAGAGVAAGTYWVRLATRDGIQSRRILRLR